MKVTMLTVLALSLLLMGTITVQQANASTPPIVHFNSSPIITWYNQTPYEYAASISAPYNWTLKTNASLHMSSGNTANDTTAQTVFGILSTGSYWVNVSITYHNATNVTTLLIYQNFTLTIFNKPYIYSTPETFFYQDSTYNYTYEINQGNITNYSSGFTLNETTHTLSEYLSGTSYSFFLTVSDSNGTYTQYWGVSTNSSLSYSFTANLSGTRVSVISMITDIGVNNTSLLMDSYSVLSVPATSYSYSLVIMSQTAYSISTTSALAPNVTLSFNLLPPGSYRVYMTSRTSGTTIVLNNVTSAGTVNVTYDPATMPLDPTFEVAPVLSPPPPYNPVHPAPPMNFFPGYVFIILLGVSAIGVGVGVYYLFRRR